MVTKLIITIFPSNIQSFMRMPIKWMKYWAIDLIIFTYLVYFFVFANFVWFFTRKTFFRTIFRTFFDNYLTIFPIFLKNIFLAFFKIFLHFFPTKILIFPKKSTSMVKKRVFSTNRRIHHSNYSKMRIFHIMRLLNQNIHSSETNPWYVLRFMHIFLTFFGSVSGCMSGLNYIPEIIFACVLY